MSHTVEKNVTGTSLFDHTVEHSGKSGLAKHDVFEHLDVKTLCKTEMFYEKHAQ